mmetsp:Transcript_52232/g.127577  ORF Transcript_52232/g.127577 Transcript_52232/m.127577 type:complete len:215 (+) Transcript_52232:858-1502(+)
MRKRRHALEAPAVGGKVHARGARLPEASAVRAGGTLLPRTAVDPLVVAHQLHKLANRRVHGRNGLLDHLDASWVVDLESTTPEGGRRRHQVRRGHLALLAKSARLKLEGLAGKGLGLLDGSEHGVKRLPAHPVAVQSAIEEVHGLSSLGRTHPVDLGPPTGDTVQGHGRRLLRARPRFVYTLPGSPAPDRVGRSEECSCLGHPHLLSLNVAFKS